MSNLPKIENVTLQILRMDESSGNIQIFVRAKRTDDNSSKLFQETLEYQCFQTKHMQYKECLSRAWFSATKLCNFFLVSLSSLPSTYVLFVSFICFSSELNLFL